MTPSRVAAWMFGAAVLGAWLASAAGVSRQETSGPPARTDAPHPVDHLASDVQMQAARLRQRMDAAPAPQVPVRNPFAFSPRVEAAPRMPRPAPPVAAALPPPAPPEPMLDLIGIAEKTVNESVVRTAMLADDSGDVIMATAGQRVIGLYEVVAIGADAVELKNTVSGAIRRLILR